MKNENKNYNELQLLHSRIQTGIQSAILIIVVIVGIFACVMMGGITKQVKNLDRDKINAAISTLETVAEGLKEVDVASIEKAVSELGQAAATLSKTDMDAVNEGIQALKGAAENLQGLDMEKLNELITTLETVSERMDATTSAFSKLFPGRG